MGTELPSTTSPSTPIVCTTRDVALPQRRAYWLDMLCATYVRLESRIEDEDDFYGSIAMHRLGDVQLSRVQHTAPSVRRSARSIARSDDASLLVHIAHVGPARVEQGGRTAHLAQGDITVYTSTDPYDLAFHAWSDTRVLKLDIADIRPHVGNVEDLTALVIPAQAAENALLRAMVSSLWSHAGAHQASSAPALTSALIQSAAAALQTLPRASRKTLSNLERYHLARAKTFIADHIRRDSLSVREVAAAVGLSPRHLARLFENEPLPPSRFITAMRLEGCSRDLLARPRSARSIADIAYSWGFGSANSFNRAFRASFDCSPSEWMEKKAAPVASSWHPARPARADRHGHSPILGGTARL